MCYRKIQVHYNHDLIISYNILLTNCIAAIRVCSDKATQHGRLRPNITCGQMIRYVRDKRARCDLVSKPILVQMIPFYHKAKELM